MGERLCTLPRVRAQGKLSFLSGSTNVSLPSGQLCCVPRQMQADAMPGLRLSSLPCPAPAGPSVLPRAWCLPRSLRLAGAARSFWRKDRHACHAQMNARPFFLWAPSLSLRKVRLFISSPETQSHRQHNVSGCRWCSQMTNGALES